MCKKVVIALINGVVLTSIVMVMICAVKCCCNDERVKDANSRIDKNVMYGNYEKVYGQERKIPELSDKDDKSYRNVDSALMVVYKESDVKFGTNNYVLHHDVYGPNLYYRAHAKTETCLLCSDEGKKQIAQAKERVKEYKEQLKTKLATYRVDNYFWLIAGLALALWMLRSALFGFEGFEEAGFSEDNEHIGMFIVWFLLVLVFGTITYINANDYDGLLDGDGMPDLTMPAGIQAPATPGNACKCEACVKKAAKKSESKPDKKKLTIDERYESILKAEEAAEQDVKQSS